MNIDNKSLSLNVYDYLSFCQNTRKTKAAGVITDKQFVFYTAVDNHDYSTHNDIHVQIEQALHPNRKLVGWDAYQPNHAYISIVAQQFYLDLSERKKLGYVQREFVREVLEQVKRFNKDYQTQITLTCNDPFFTTTDVEEFKNYICQSITSEITVEEEEIIGKTLPKEKMKEALKQYLDLSQCNYLWELSSVIYRAQKLQEDSYYQNYFKEVFPNFEQQKSIIKFLLNQKDTDIQIHFENFEDLEQKLIVLVENMLKHQKNIKELKRFLDNLKTLDKTILTKYFPQFDLVYSLFLEIYLIELNSSLPLEPITDYKSLCQLVAWKADQYKQENIKRKYQVLEMSERSFQSLKTKQHILESKTEFEELLKQIYSSKKELNVNETQRNKNVIFQTNTQKNIQDLEIKIETQTSTKLGHFLNYRQTKKAKQDLVLSKANLDRLKQDEKILANQEQEWKKNVEGLETSFKEQSGLSFIPATIQELNDYLTDFDSQRLQLIADKVEKIKLEIKKQEVDIEKIVQSGLISLNKTQEPLEMNNHSSRKM